MLKTAVPATAKQLTFILSLGKDRVCPEGHPFEMELDVMLNEHTYSITRDGASKMIEEMLTWDKKGKPKQAAVLPGMYLAPNGDVIKVQQSRGSKNVYAKLMTTISGTRLTLTDDIVNFDFTYVPGLITHITPAMKINTEMAAAFGLKTGRCMWCRKELKVASSVLQGMGPVCAKKFL